MVLLHVKNVEELEALRADLDAVSEFDHIDLHPLNTLVLMEVAGQAAMHWLSQPAIHSEEDAVAVYPFSRSGVQWLCEHVDELQKLGVSVEALADFAARSTGGGVFALDTF